MVKDETQSVRISKEVVRDIKINIANHGGTIRSILELGAYYAIEKNAKKKKAL